MCRLMGGGHIFNMKTFHLERRVDWKSLKDEFSTLFGDVDYLNTKLRFYLRNCKFIFSQKHEGVSI